MGTTAEQRDRLRSALKTKVASKAALGGLAGSFTGLAFGGTLGAALGAAADMDPNRIYKGSPPLRAAMGYRTGKTLGSIPFVGGTGYGKGTAMAAAFSEAGARSVKSEHRNAKTIRDLKKLGRGLSHKLVKLVKNNKKAALSLGLIGAAGLGAKSGTTSFLKSRENRGLFPAGL